MVSSEWHSCSSSHDIWVIFSVVPQSSYFPPTCPTGFYPEVTITLGSQFYWSQALCADPSTCCCSPRCHCWTSCGHKGSNSQHPEQIFSQYLITVNVEIFYYEILLHTWKNVACASCCCPGALSFSPSGAALSSVFAPQLRQHFPPPKAFHEIRKKKKKISLDRCHLTQKLLDSRFFKRFSIQGQITLTAHTLL